MVGLTPLQAVGVTEEMVGPEGVVAGPEVSLASLISTIMAIIMAAIIVTIIATIVIISNIIQYHTTLLPTTRCWTGGAARPRGPARCCTGSCTCSTTLHLHLYTSAPAPLYLCT